MTYPKIGIRPTIDGRWGGVRESLEVQTMGMATAAKALIEEICTIRTARRYNACSPLPPSAAAQRQPSVPNILPARMWLPP